ncbi:hypothetical protein CLBKND_04236 [Methylorubrum aminovorans]
MKTRLTMRAALALGLPSLARGIGRKAVTVLVGVAGHLPPECSKLKPGLG